MAQEGKHEANAQGQRRDILCSVQTSDIVLIPLKQSVIDMTFGQSLH